MAVLTALGVGLQQTQADFFIMHRIVHGPLPTRQYIPVDGEWTDYAAEWGKRFVNSFTNWADRRFSSSSPPDPAAVTGAPWPWQAYDPVGPWSVVNLANGNLHTVIPIAAWPGVQFNLYHNSLGSHELASLGGRGWLHSYSAHLDIDGDDVIYIADDGREVPFTLVSGEDENEVYRMKIELVDDDPDYYVVTDAAQNTMTFNLSGVLQELADASGNTTTLVYDTGRLSTITDQVGRAITLTYDNQSPKRLIMIEIPPMLNRSEEDSGGEDDDIERIAELTYGSQSSDDFLQRVYSMRRETCLKVENEYPLFWVEIEYEATSSRIEWITDYGDGGSDGTNDHHTWNFEYYNSGGGHRFQEVTNPAVYDFDADDEVATTRAYAYGTPAGGEVTTTVTDERENDWVYTFDDPAGRLLSLEDPLSRMLAQITWTDLNRPASIINVLGGETTFDYTFNMDGSETIEVLGPQNEDPVIIDLDELNRLTQITDPFEQVTAFAYDDAANPTRMTEMNGPGDANTANFCWTRLDNGKLDPDPLGGLPKATASPTNTTQGFFYDGFGNLRGWEQPANTEADVCSNIPLRESGGGLDNAGCCNDSRAYLHNSTGERLASGAAAGSCCDTGYDPGTGCPRQSGNCAVTGCGTGRDGSGNPNRSFCTHSACSEFNPPGSSPTPRGGEEDTTCDSQFLANPPIVHDANNRLVSVSKAEGGSREQIGYELAYDARGRLTSYDVEAENDFDDYYNGVNDFHLAPNYSTLSEYSDTTGGFRETYTRINADEATERTIETTYETDEAGRITSVDRDGVVTQYTYSDNGSPAVPNITVIHDDGARSLYYLNDAGELCKIVHQRPSGPGDSPMDVVASFEVISRDDNRRITEIEENFLDPGAADDYRTERVTFTYGDGDLDAGHLDTDSATEVEHDKVYWDFLADLNSGLPLASSDPNRLVREHRTLIDEGYSGADAVTYDKRYYYDPNGNRLAVVEVDPEDEEVLRSVARYNYAYEGVLDGDGEDRPPGVPDVVNSPQWMDYAAHGRDQLLSTQTLYFEGDEYNTLDRVAVETFEYAGYGTPGAFYVAAHMLYRQRTTYRWDAKLGKGGRWWTQIVKNTRYEYDSFSNPDRLQKQEYSYTVYDVPEEELPLGDVLHEGAIGEFSGYDELLGRRIATWRCEAVDSTVIDWGPSGGDCKDETECKARTMMFDYYGLSQRVAAMRRSSWRCADRAGTPNRAAPVRKRALRAGLAGSGLSHPCVNEGDAPCNPYEKGDAPCSPYERGDAPCNTYEKADAPCNPYEKGDAPC
ncbi:MAG: DUF6531 domain-containing protein, partial [Phycisphaerae bacterium]|nr:DUF6531 domain-containing protein [Phycisphaerae bacterium]